MYEFVTGHFLIALPMFIMSGAGLTLLIWRVLLNMNTGSDMNELLPLFQEKLDREGAEGALRMCRARNDIIPRKLFVAGLEASSKGLGAMRRAMQNAIELEILPDLNFLLPPILAIAKIATMVGLLGTVISMINVFSKIQSGADPTAHSREIGLALFATALGLVTAIPLVFAHVLFRARVINLEAKMKKAAQTLLVLMQSAKAAKPAAAGAAAVARPADAARR